METLAQIRRTRLQQTQQTTQQPKPRFRLSSLFSWDALGVLIPIIIGLVGWYLVRKKKSKLKGYFEQIDQTYGQYKVEGKKCEAELYALKESIEQDLKDGKIEDSAYNLLNERIARYLKDIKTTRKST